MPPTLENPTEPNHLPKKIVLSILFFFVGMIAIASFVLANQHMKYPVLAWVFNGAALWGFAKWYKQSQKAFTTPGLLNAYGGIIILVSMMATLMFPDPSKPMESSPEPYVAQEDSSSAGTTNTETSKTYKRHESFKVGYTRYEVKGIEWRQRLGNEYFGKTADSRYLLVSLLIKNEDKQNRSIPPFTLVDAEGNSYDEAAGDSMYLGDNAVIFDSLNPGVQKKAILVFDIPPKNQYDLVVSGGYWSGEEAHVKLN